MMIRKDPPLDQTRGLKDEEKEGSMHQLALHLNQLPGVLPVRWRNPHIWCLKQISALAKQTDARSSFNELLDTPIDFSNFIMNRLDVDTLTPELLAGPTYELMRGSSQSQAKDTLILKLREKLQSISGDVKERKVKREIKVIETLNIELDHRMTKLVAENDHLKQTYKQLYDSIKPSRVRSKEQCVYLIKQVNLKSAEIFDLNVSLREKVLVITALKESLSKLKGKDVVNEAVPLHSIDPELLKIDVAPLAL
nr:hypothetical protein [Tanacetum cinerariifolium]